jgi:hypothetical protein
MNLLAIAVVVLALAQSGDPALVEASKEAKAKRKASTTKVITNADVAKSKGKVAQRKGVPIKVTAPPTLREKYEAERTARLAREAKMQTLGETIAALEKELARLEQSYYEENDLGYRDGEITRRFAETKAKLDDARAQLAALTPPAE